MSGTSTATPTRNTSAQSSAQSSSRASRPALGQVPGRPLRRVRHEVRDGVAVMLFSAAVSSGLAVLLTVLARLGN